MRGAWRETAAAIAVEAVPRYALAVFAPPSHIAWMALALTLALTRALASIWRARRLLMLPLLGFAVSCGAAACQGKGCGKVTCPEGTILIPPGTFEMGSNEELGISVQSPAHQVTLTKPYCIDRTEVTMGARWRCFQQKKCQSVRDTVRDMPPNWPADFVSWQDAYDYCHAQGGRLPTDAEWEYAARGTDGRRYPWGNDSPTDEHWRWQPRGDIPATVTNVGTHPKGRSFFGLEDMSGNLKEWVADYCHGYPAGPVTDPKGPSSAEGDCRIKRGAGWSAPDESSAQATLRFYGRRPRDRDDQTGFRCVYDPR